MEEPPLERRAKKWSFESLRMRTGFSQVRREPPNGATAKESGASGDPDKSPDALEPPFGALRPNATQEIFRRLAHRLPDVRLARKLASLLLGPAGGRSGRAFDVEIFGAQKARLHPRDNISEKRVFLTPQHWDARERALLACAIASHADDTFFFADVGANAGLYALFARSEAMRCGRRLRAVCVEPDDVMRARLAFNVAASGAGADIAVLPFAATAADGPLRFAVNLKNRGMSRVDAAGAVEVEGRTLPRLLREAGFARVDALKIDVEGHEHAALAPLFRDAAPALAPRLLILEVSHGDPARSARALALSAGYLPLFEGRLNWVLERRPP